MKPAIVDHELRTRGQLQHRASRNGGPKAVKESPRLFKRRLMAEDMQEAQLRPIPKRLAGDVWHQGETVIEFGGSGEGKTALAIQIANDIAGGNSTTGLECEAGPSLVAYFDFELSDIQHLKRYSEQTEDGRFTNPFKFHPNLIRVSMNPSTRVFDRIIDYEQFMIREIEREIVESGAKIVIIDNITYLAREQDKVKFALPMMQRLCELKKDHDLSMVILAHTPKRDDARPMSLNDLAGSRILANFADSVFSLGKSAIDPRLRILKQHKVRSGELVYGADHVGVFRFEKNINFLGFELIGHAHESKHLKQQHDEDREKLIADIRAMHDAGNSQRDIANALTISVGLVNKHLKRSRVTTNAEGRVEIEFLDEDRKREWESWKPSTTK